MDIEIPLDLGTYALCSGRGGRYSYELDNHIQNNALVTNVCTPMSDFDLDEFGTFESLCAYIEAHDVDLTKAKETINDIIATGQRVARECPAKGSTSSFFFVEIIMPGGTPLTLLPSPCNIRKEATRDNARRPPLRRQQWVHPARRQRAALNSPFLLPPNPSHELRRFRRENRSQNPQM